MNGTYAWMNAAVLPMTSALHSVFDNVVSYGGSVFEGIRIYAELNKNDEPTGRRSVWLLNEHIRRLRDSARAYRMLYGYSDTRLQDAVCDLAARNSADTYVRPIVFRGEGLGVDPITVPVNVAIGTLPWGKYVVKHLHNECASAYVTNVIRPSRRVLRQGQAKGAPNYGAFSQEAKMQANEAQASEALLLGDFPNRLMLADGSGMNLCIVERGHVFTPHPSEWNILHGLTLRFLMEWTTGKDQVPFHFDNIWLERLMDADEVFLTGTATEVTPVTLIKYRNEAGDLCPCEVGNGLRGPVARRLQEILQAATQHPNGPYKAFRTYVPEHVHAMA